VYFPHYGWHCFARLDRAVNRGAIVRDNKGPGVVFTNGGHGARPRTPYPLRAIAPPDAGGAEPRLPTFGEQPFVLALLPLFLGIGELIEAIGDDEAAAGRELTPLERSSDRREELSRYARSGLGDALFRLRDLLGFFGTSSKLSPVDGGGQHDVAVCVRERELGQMIALNRVPVAVGCRFHVTYRFYEGDRRACLT
jgi:hypothetical protein